MVGLAIGLFAGFVRWADGIIMRVIDGMMSIPPILLAIALMALTRGSVRQRHHRHHRRRDPARRAASCAAWCCRCASSPMSRRQWRIGARTPRIIFRHILPNTDGADDGAGDLYLRQRR